MKLFCSYHIHGNILCDTKTTEKQSFVSNKQTVATLPHQHRYKERTVNGTSMMITPLSIQKQIGIIGTYAY